MKGIVIEQPGKIEIKELPTPVRKAGEALLKIEMVGICGSDITALQGANPTMTYPRVMGHEAIGTILEVDENVENLKVGDRVAIEPYLHCGHCSPCRRGDKNNCQTLDVIGVRKDGAMVEQFTHPTKHLFKIPDTLSTEEATMVEPLSISLHAIHRANVIGGEFVLIFGAGTIGFLAALICKAYGAKPILVDLLDDKLELAKSMGIEYTINSKKVDLLETLNEITKEELAPVVLECSGSPKAMYDTWEVAAYGGRIVFVGWAKGDITINQPPLLKKELMILGSRCSYNEFPECIDLLDRKLVNVKPILDIRYSLEDVMEGFHDIIDNPGKFLKIIGRVK